ncbi:helix-turn-helix transcriptional regulator [Paenibacillus antarcticus]|uniref:DNA-binding transcriptional regulator n=1 Tax=Paenibacillus antarcticus TaxID=253703 RepID=A0A168J6U2_9BACL|nr:WYL domain-containing protein [Paenibacillus antarcticus]OAB40229.1 hypothetical protein PBAT_23230 [Paenibacillus antarcticus]
MNKFQQLNAVWLYINQAKVFNAKDIAAQFNISERTVQRYIAELSELGLPITSEAGRGGGYRVMPNKLLPPISFTHDEVFSIFFAYQSIENVKGLPFHADYHTVLNKLLNQTEEKFRSEIDDLKEYILFLSPNRDYDNPFLKEIFIHSRNKDTIIISYQSINQHSVKKVIPIGLYTSKGLWYVVASDVSKDKIVTLRVDRIKDLEFHHSNSDKLNLPTLQNWLSNIGNESLGSTIKFHVELTSQGVMKCRDNEFLDKYIRHNEDGTGFVEIDVPESELNHMTEYFFTLHQDATIITPLEAITRICAMAKGIVDKYIE